MTKFAIIGSGISGIAAAYYLHKNNQEFDIFEASDTVGGRVGGAKLGNKIVDLGGKNIGYNYKLFREFIKDQGSHEYEYFGVNTSKIRNGKIIPINREKNFKSLLNLLKLSSPLDLIKLFKHVKKVKDNLDNGLLNSNFYNNLADKLDHKPLSNHFGKKCIDNLIRPMTIRMNGAEPEECYIGNFGTNIRTAFDKYEQLTTGLNNILSSFSKKINITLNTQVTEIKYIKNKVRLTLKSNGREKFTEYDHIIIATPAYIAKDLINKASSKASNALKSINYFPVGVIVASYKESVFNSDVRAMVFDKNQPISNIGAYGIDDLNVVRYTFSGKTFRKKFGKKLTPEKAIKLAESLVPGEFNIKGNKRINYIYHYWDKGLCAYSSYHYKKLQLVDNELENKKISLVGDYIKGASIEACFSSSKEAVEKLLK